MPRISARVVCTLRRDDRDLGADQRVDQRRFAGIGRADERDEAAARVGLRPAQPSASRSAHRRLRASAWPRRRPARRRAWSGPMPSAGCAIGEAHGDAELAGRGPGRSARSRDRPASAGRAPCAHSCRTVFASRSGRAGVCACAPATARSISAAAAAIAAVEKDRADQRLADVGEDRRSRCRPPALRFRVAEPRSPRRDRSRARPRRRSPCAPDRPGGATARPRRRAERRETACRRSTRPSTWSPRNSSR